MSNITPGRVKRLRNLPKFRDKTDAEIISYLEEVAPQKEAAREAREVKKNLDPDKTYRAKFNVKMREFQQEYGIDMNNANDAETLKALVRQSIQAEDVDKKIRESLESKIVDNKQLKDFSDVQRSITMSINDLQEKLGITRKTRKETQVDDIPAYLREIRQKAKTMWDRSTHPVKCEKCQIELSRFWLNFPRLASKVSFELECWRCGERVVYNR